jgi:hypothetical protein
MASENALVVVESANGVGGSDGQKRKKQIETIKNGWVKKMITFFQAK